MNKFLKVVNVLCWFAFLGLTFFCIATNPFANTSSGDSAFFSYIGRMWCRGYVPYRDYFDHKGPMIFFINMLGQLPGCYFFPLWLIEILFAILSGIVIKRFVNYVTPTVSTLVIQLSVAAFVVIFLPSCYGNLNETYAFLFIAFPLLGCLHDAMEFKTTGKLQALLYGMCFMTLFLFKANMVIVAFVVAAFYIGELVRTKNIRVFLINSELTCLGMALVLLPFVFYFVAKDALYDALYGSILLNLRYTAHATWLWTWCFYPLLIVMSLNAVEFFFFKVDNSIKRALKYNLGFLVMTFLVLLKTPFHLHYFIIFVPGVVLPIAVFLAAMPHRKVFYTLIAVPSFLALLIACAGANFDVTGFVRHLKDGGSAFDIFSYKEGSQYNDLHVFRNFIKDTNSVFVYGAECHIYQYLLVSGEFRYFGFTRSAVQDYAPEMRAAMVKHIDEAIDRYVIVCLKSAESIIVQRFRPNYHEIARIPNYVLLERNIP